MSAKVSGMVWESGLAGNELLVALALADWANEVTGEQIFPSRATVARKTRLSERTVQRIVGEFRESGLLDVVEEARQHKAVHYRMNLDRLREMKAAFAAAGDPARGDKLSPLDNDAGETRVSPLAGNPGETNGAPGETPATSRGDTAVSPNPSEIHQLEKARAREAGAAPGAPASALGEGEAADAQPIPAEIAARLESMLGKAACASWLSGCRWRPGDRGRWPGGEIIAPSRFHAEYVENQFGHKLIAAFGGKVRVIDAERAKGAGHGQAA